jgi:hypothetical protein
MTWISDYQRWLSEEESLQNAQLVANHLKSTWSRKSIAALCGNMRHESSINPDMYEYGYDWSADRGYGLVQWTPRSKYWDWATSQGLDQRNGDSQLSRIDYEVEKNIQWIPKASIGYMTFKQFRSNSGNWSIDYLTEAFMWGYERPATSAGNASLAERQAFAHRCYNELDWTGAGTDTVGYQLAQFPMDTINISQGENGSYSHKGTLCIDFLGKTDVYPYYAPCDCECIARDDSNAFLVWKSSKKVMCADGQVRYIVWDCFHDSNPLHSVGTKLNKGDLMGHSGIGGNVTGDHLHLNVIEGSKYTGFTYKPDPALSGTELHIFDVFAVNGVDIVNGLGYDWKTSDYKDGSQGGSNQNTGGIDKRVISLLLSDTLNGWRL